MPLILKKANYKAKATAVNCGDYVFFENYYNFFGRGAVLFQKDYARHGVNRNFTIKCRTQNGERRTTDYIP